MRMHPEKGKYMMEGVEKSNNLTSKSDTSLRSLKLR